MARVLLVEDSPTQSLEFRLMLEGAGHEVTAVVHGKQALESLAARLPDVVLTDLDMPEMNGLELVTAIHERAYSVPVVLMTAFGSEEIALRSLARGAASYVPKRNAARDLVETLETVLNVARANRGQRHPVEYLTDVALNFCLTNDASAAMPVVAHIQSSLAEMNVLNDTQRIRLGVAIEAALNQAMYHGNLELTSAQLQDAYHLEDGGQSYYRMLAERRSQGPYSDRRVYLSARISHGEIVCLVRHEGMPFNPAVLQELATLGRLEDDADRGWLLQKLLLDEIRIDESGRELTLVKRPDR